MIGEKNGFSIIMIQLWTIGCVTDEWEREKAIYVLSANGVFINYMTVCSEDNHKANLRDSPFDEWWIASYGRCLIYKLFKFNNWIS